jgi:hypothetical protein
MPGNIKAVNYKTLDFSSLSEFLVATGNSFFRGSLYVLLSNPIYIGEIRHKGVRHPGLHEPWIASFGRRRSGCCAARRCGAGRERNRPPVRSWVDYSTKAAKAGRPVTR